MRYKLLVVLTILTLLAAFVPAFFAPIRVQATSTVILTSQDTYIQSGLESQNDNYGSEEHLGVGHYQAVAPPYPSFTDRTLLEFEIWAGNPIPPGAQVVLAYLQLYYYDYDGSDPAGSTVYAQRLMQPNWVESVATWRCYGHFLLWAGEGASQVGLDYTTTNQSSATVPAVFAWVNWDVTAQVQWAQANHQNVEMRITAAVETSSALPLFRSREYTNATYRPRLVVNYVLPSAPVVGTISAYNETFDSAICYGRVIDTGSADVTVRGFKYGLTESDTFDTHATGNFTVGDYSFNLTNLIPNSTYYFRAYATNTYGTAYGSWKSFSTGTGIPIVTTDSVYVYAYCMGISATMSGTIVNIGNSTVTRRGFEWDTSPYAGSPGTEYENGIFSTGSYVLTANIGTNLTYWFRAYATNAAGTGYGIWKPFYDNEEPCCDCPMPVEEPPVGCIEIHDVAELQAMSNNLSGCYYLANDIDCSGYSFIAVGNSTSPFTGNLYGLRYTVYNLTVNSPGSNYVGLFGYASGSEIYDVLLEIEATGYNYVGGLIGYSDNVDATCCTVSGSITGHDYVGMVAGSIAGLGSTTYQYCTASGSVIGNNYVGGFAGRKGSPYICDSFAAVDVIANSGAEAVHQCVGGFVGFFNAGIIRRCFATGDVTGTHDSVYRTNVGGFVGHAYYYDIYDCYARGAVIANNNYSGGIYAYAGGFAGQLQTPVGGNSHLYHCYATGAVAATGSYDGGLCGYGGTGVSDHISDCFWDIQTSGNIDSTVGTGKDTTAMKTQSTFTNWDFNTIWEIDDTYGIINDGYPYFGWALTTPPEEGTKYTLSLSSNTGGNVTIPGEGSFNYTYGQVVSLVATPELGYRFALWVGNVSEIADVQSYTTTVTMTSDFTIMAVFVESGKLALYITSTDGGNCTDPGEGVFSYDYGDLVDIEAIADGGYSFSLWSGDVSTIADVYLSTTLIELLDDCAIKANFATTGNYVLVISSTGAGNVIDPGEGTYIYSPATIVNLEAWPNPDSWFVEWTGNVSTVANVTDPTTTITMNDDYAIVANFGSGGDFDLTTSSSEGGDVTTPGEGTYTYSPGTTVNIEATAAAGYNFFAWTGDVSTIADVGDESTTIVMNGDYLIIANFEAAEVCSLLLTISAAEGGSVTEPGEGVFTFPCGLEIVVTAQAYTGWWFKEWTGDTGGVANPLSFNTTVLMNSDFFIEATFEEEESPPPGAPNVTTGNATSITNVSATLHGELTSLGNYTEAYVFLQYGTNTSYGVNTPMQLRTSIGNFTRTISNLVSNTTYHYRAAAQYDSYVYGLDGNFTTLSEESEEPPGYDYNTCDGTYEYESYTTGDNETATIYGANWFAQTFNVTEAFKISAMRLKLSKTGTPGALTVSLRDVDGTGKPTGVDLVSASYEGTGTSTGWYEITMPTYRLETDEYAIVVRAIAGDAGSYISWYYDPTGVYDGGAYVSSSDSGVSWSVDEDKDLMFQMFGTTVLCIMDVKVFSGYLEDDDWLIAIHYLNEFPPYYGVATPSDYFDLQLVVGGEVVASVGVPLWGNMPGSIYLSQELASTLEWGSIYTVRMRGSFSPYPTSTYTLIPADWRGQDLNLLDAWVFEVASVMSTYYEQSMTTYIARRLVLNDAGSALFATGIPMLAAVRPLIFLDPELYTPESAEDWQRTYENAQHWQEVLGAKITSDAETAGNIFGVTGMQFAQVAFFGTWFVASLGAAAFAGIAALVVSLPFLAGGWYVGLIPTTIFAVLGSIFILVLVWYFWIRGGG